MQIIQWMNLLRWEVDQADGIIRTTIKEINFEIIFYFYQELEWQLEKLYLLYK